MLEIIVEACPEGIIGLDRQGVIRLFNPAAEKLTGWSKGEVVGKLSITRLYHGASLARQLKKELYSEEYGGVGRIVDREITLLSKDGRELPIRLSGALIMENGVEVGSVGYFQDVSERNKAMAQLMKSERLQGVLEMAGAAAHEMAQPLQVILGDSEFILDQELSRGEIKESASAILEASGRMRDIISKIQNITKYRSRKYTENSDIVDIDEASS